MDPTADASPLLAFLLTHDEAFRSRPRLSSLYSDFGAQQATNPDGYNANISAWRKALGNAARAGLLPGGDALVVSTGEHLLRDLSLRGWGRPGCLGLVLNDALAKGEMVPVADFMSGKGVYARRGHSIWSLASWALRRLGVLGSDSSPSDRLAVGEFVVMANVEAAASAVTSLLSRTGATSMPSLIYSPSTFTSAFSHAFSPTHALTNRDTSILLTHLSRDLHACSYDPASGVVKFALPSQPPAPSPPPITETDRSIARLKTLIHALAETAVPALATRVASAEKEAREAVAARQTATARAALRGKKQAAAALEKRRAALDRLRDVYARIETAADNVAFARVMEAAAAALAALNREVGGADRAGDVVDSLRVQMQVAEDVDRVLGGGAAGGVDECEVEEEFEALERAEREMRMAAVRREREEAERREAEATRARLGELDRLDEAGKEKGAEKSTLALAEKEAVVPTAG